MLPIILDTADANGSGFASLTTRYGFANVRRALPALPHSPIFLSSWQGAVHVPADFGGAATITLVMAADNALASKAARLTVGTSGVSAGGAWDTAFNDEAYVDVPVPDTPNERFDYSWAMSGQPVAGQTLNVIVYRDGSHAGDTLTGTNVLIVECLFEYVAA